MLEEQQSEVTFFLSARYFEILDILSHIINQSAELQFLQYKFFVFFAIILNALDLVSLGLLAYLGARL